MMTVSAADAKKKTRKKHLCNISGLECYKMLPKWRKWLFKSVGVLKTNSRLQQCLFSPTHSLR